MSRTDECRFDFPMIGNELSIKHWCKKFQKEIVDGSECNDCECFKNKYIVYPIEVTGLDLDEIDYSGLCYKNRIGQPVKIRPCNENNTYLGVFVGELPLHSTASFNEETGRLKIGTISNPAILVPTLGKIVFGCESWWSFVENEDDLEKEISDDMINNQWYIKAIKSMCKSEKEGNENV